MKLLLSIAIILPYFFSCDACAGHSRPGQSPKPNTYLGTVQQGCSPGVIASVAQLIIDPTRCDLRLGPLGCDLCQLRLYLPAMTSSKFTVQPLEGEFSINSAPHIEATKCKCSEGCYFHQASISPMKGFPAPKRFSEPFACFSDISTGGTSPVFTFLIWCESDGGCPNQIVSRYMFFSRFEVLSPSRPAHDKGNIFLPRIVELPKSKCKTEGMSEESKNFIRGVKKPTVTEKKTPDGRECSKCRKAKKCISGICFEGKCLKSLSDADKKKCGIATGGNGTCNEAERVKSCMRACL